MRSAEIDVAPLLDGLSQGACAWHSTEEDVRLEIIGRCVESPLHRADGR